MTFSAVKTPEGGGSREGREHQSRVEEQSRRAEQKRQRESLFDLLGRKDASKVDRVPRHVPQDGGPEPL